MLISYKWLQRFFDPSTSSGQVLPSPEEVAGKLTFGAFEIESVEKRGSDTIFDVSVLPDRACYALSHRGIAREVATLCGLTMKDPFREPYPDLTPRTDKISVTVEDGDRARYYAAALIKGVSVGPSPAWLKAHLEAVDQQSINNIVDATNFVMLHLGTPLHAFDADTLSGAISVRAAKDGEKITVLSGEEKTLTSEMTVIADGEKDIPIAIAGAKGGTHAEITDGTKNIILEAAKFDPTRTRKTAQALNLKTESSKCFENKVPVEAPAYGMRAVVELILEIAGGELAGYAATDLIYKHPYKLGVSTEEISSLLGSSKPLGEKEIESTLGKLGFTFENIENPVERAIAIAREHIGKPYEYAASITLRAPHAFDCSSFVAYAYVEAGIPIPRTSVDQYIWGEPIEEKDLKSGDLVFSNSNQGKIWLESDEYLPGKKVPEGIDHVGLCAGAGRVIHATRYAKGVVEEEIEKSKSFAGVIVGYRRIVKSIPRLSVLVPFERLDLRIPEDLVEEIARVRGYESLAASPLPKTSSAPEINSQYYLMEKIRGVLHTLDFTEIYTYSLQKTGDVKLANALTSDKAFLRKNLGDAMEQKLTLNIYNSPLIGSPETIKLFEIGQVFTKQGEQTHLCLGMSGGDPDKGKKINAALKNIFGATFPDLGGSINEFDVTSLLQSSNDAYPVLPLVDSSIQYKPPSPYPFILRDIALWVSEGVEAGEVKAIIQKEGGDLLVRIDQFDEFSKDGRMSHAFHLVFQSHEKTLSDDEVNKVMEGVQNALKNKGWEVR
jgi:phenylalanyl-tRNA synthetase beta subunit